MLVHNARGLALYVKDSRKTQKLSQTQIANKVGLLQSTISSFENDPNGTKLDTLFRILSAANLQIHIVEVGADLKNINQSQWREEW